MLAVSQHTDARQTHAVRAKLLQNRTKGPSAVEVRRLTTCRLVVLQFELKLKQFAMRGRTAVRMYTGRDSGRLIAVLN
ncbi:unnamed protein product, partial [Iphiclides podalirius]